MCEPIPILIVRIVARALTLDSACRFNQIVGLNDTHLKQGVRQEIERALGRGVVV
ncbi:hypothetical protein [Sphingopyxis witflariensis]|uniref:hypothetical protein n=1 Tax=Sphingopyxis witflariensis TaxID=173675 RepID=UPI001303B433|nr:hypothetical protein [Sphingopyxis witflariensis]